MIRETELRIGNLLNHNNGSMVGSFIMGLIHLEDIVKDNSHASEYEPILLTEEWLLKFGFEKTNIKMSGCNVWQKGKYRVLKSYLNDDNSYSLCIDGITPPTWAIAKFEYVHQFQNIYFALEKQELEIKK
jgi:hypothetical protein